MGRRKGSVNKVDVANLPRGVTFLKDGRDRPFVVRHRKLKAESFKTAEDAVARKKELIELESSQGVEALTYSRAVHADVMEARAMLPSGVSHAQTARFWLKHHSGESLQVAEAVEKFIDLRKRQSICPNGWTRHTKDLNSRLGRFALSFGNQFLSEITSGDLLNWLGELSAPDKSELCARSIANYRRALENFFNYAFRRAWVVESPMQKVTQEDLPTVRRGQKKPLTVAQADKLLEFVAEVTPRFLIHFALRLFLGVRTSESRRFQWDWVQPGQSRILIPGWFYTVENEIQRGSKTGDDWAIHDVPERFWRLFNAEKRPAKGNVPKPSTRYWHGYDERTRRRCLKRQIIEAIGLDAWPHNVTRDTFCTLHMSAYRSAERTALVLKHRNSQTLWQSYLGTLINCEDAKKFFN